MNIFCSKKKDESNKYLAFILLSKDEPFSSNYYATEIHGSCGVLRWRMRHTHSCIMNCGAFVKSSYFYVQKKRH